MPNSVSPPKTICLMRLSAIGDVTHALAMVTRIKRTWPTAQITWIIGKVEYQLLKHTSGIEFIVCDKRAKNARTELQRALKHREFDVLLQMQIAFRANWLGSVVRAKRRVGFDKARSKELHSWFINERIQGHSRVHVLDGFMQFADAIGVPKAPVEWDLGIPATDLDWAKAQIKILERFIIIAPAASKAQRNWLNQYYAKVIDWCATQGISIVLCGGPGALDKACQQGILEHTHNVTLDLIGKTSLLQMAALMRHAACVIAPDTGPAHMASMMGAPVLGLYAHSNPQRTGPYRSIDQTISVYSEAIEAEYGKPWSELEWGKRAHGDELMSKITPEQVIDALQKILSM